MSDDAAGKARRRLVSFLGLGRLNAPPPYYEEVCYELEGRVSTCTPLVQVALEELIGFDEIVLLGTEDVEGRWLTGGVLESLAPNVHRKVRFERVPAGQDQTERWRLFKRVAEAIGAGGDVTFDELVLDVTHGLRIQPLLGAAAVSFALSEWQRLRLEKPPKLRVVYGAFDARVNGVAPVWDVTELVTAAQWNAALDALTRYGRADDLESLAKVTAKAAVSAVGQGGDREAFGLESHIRKIGEKARLFADDLAFGRLLSLTRRSSRELEATLRDERTRTWTTRIPVLKAPVERLMSQAGALKSDDPLRAEGIATFGAIAEYYEKTQRFLELAATIREGLVAHHALVTGKSVTYTNRGVSGWGDADEAWKAFQKSTARDPSSAPRELFGNAKLSSAAAPLRNDLEHLGLREDPRSASEARRQLHELRIELSKLLKGESDASAKAEAPPARRSVFLNLSNHPVSTWSTDQVEAARALGFGEPVDLPGGFPLVPPNASTADVVRMAEEVSARAVAEGAAAAHVSGEHTFTFALVRRLEANGIRCFAATSEREVSETVSADGSVIRTSRYRFVKWREYGDL